VIAAVGVEVTDKDAYWLGFHMERFVAYCRKHGAFLDLATAVAAYKVFIQQGRRGRRGRRGRGRTTDFGRRKTDDGRRTTVDGRRSDGGRRMTEDRGQSDGRTRISNQLLANGYGYWGAEGRGRPPSLHYGAARPAAGPQARETGGRTRDGGDGGGRRAEGGGRKTGRRGEERETGETAEGGGRTTDDGRR
jgi:hypothetical protein